MEYTIPNKIKKRFELCFAITTVVWSICTLALGVIMAISLVAIIDEFNSMQHLAENFAENGVMQIIICNGIISICAFIGVIVGGILCKSSYRNNNTIYKKRVGITVLLFVCLALYILAKIIMSFYFIIHIAELIVSFTLIFALVEFKAIAMCFYPFVDVKDNTCKNKYNQYNAIKEIAVQSVINETPNLVNKDNKQKENKKEQINEEPQKSTLIKDTTTSKKTIVNDKMFQNDSSINKVNTEAVNEKNNLTENKLPDKLDDVEEISMEIRQKIQKIQQLKAIGVITEEQYNLAVEKIKREE